MENKRILKIYKERELMEKDKNSFFGYQDIAHFFRVQNRYRSTLTLLNSKGCSSLTDSRILDIGCGNGNMLRQFLQWGAKPENLSGIELRPEAVDFALTSNPNFNIHCGSATDLPWLDNSFDLVCQHTVFTSIFDQRIKQKIASEMLRVLKVDGKILWYDFWFNPINPQTKGVPPREVKQLFPDCAFKFKKITLAPPLARKLVPVSWGLSFFLEELNIFNTHYLVLISRKNDSNL